MHYSDLNSTQSEESNMIEQDNYRPAEIDGLPPLPLDLHEHKFHICLQWGIILLTACVAPLVIYPSLHWGADLSDKIGSYLTCFFLISPVYYLHGVN